MFLFNFVKEPVDFIYLGTMTEKYQQILLSQLRPYTQRLKELLEEGVFFWCVAMD